MRLPPPTRRTLVFRTPQERKCLTQRIRSVATFYSRFAPSLGPWTMSRVELRSGAWPSWRGYRGAAGKLNGDDAAEGPSMLGDNAVLI